MDDRLSTSDDTTAAALEALDRLRSRVLSGRHEGRAPMWLGTLLFDDLRTAMSSNAVPLAHSRFDVSQAWHDQLVKTGQTADDSNKLWQLAYKNVDDAIRSIAERLAEASDQLAKPPRISRQSSGLAIAFVQFTARDAEWLLRVSGPLQDTNADNKRLNIRLLPKILPAPRRDMEKKNVNTVSSAPPVRKKFARSAILRGFIWIAIVGTAWLLAQPDHTPASPSSPQPITARLQGFSDVRLSYSNDQSSAISPVCGCLNELDARSWRGISYFGRRAVIERLSGSATTKFLITAAAPVRIRSTPYAYNIEGVVYHLEVPYSEAFDSATLLHGVFPKSYRIRARESFQVPLLTLTAAGPVRIDAYGPVPFGAWLPVEHSEVLVSTNHGMALSSHTNVVLTEHYGRWKGAAGHYPIADFIGADTVIWTEPTRQVTTSAQNRDVVAIRITNPGFATRLAVTPHAATDDGDVTLHPPVTSAATAVDRDGSIRLTLEAIDKDSNEFEDVIDRLKKDDVIWVPRIRQLTGSVVYQDKSGRFHLADPEAPPPHSMRVLDDVDTTAEFRYPPVPPRNGVNVFGVLRSLVFRDATGSIARGTVERSFAVPAFFAFRDIAQFSAAGGVITLPLVADGSSTTIRLDGSTRVEVNGQPLFLVANRELSLRRRIIAGFGFCVFATIVVSGDVIVHALRRRRKRFSRHV